MPAGRLRDFLAKNSVPHTILAHPTAYTAQTIAALTHTAGRELAKTVMVSVDGALAMAVLPATRHVDLKALKHALGATDVRLATELEFAAQFPDCEVGAMPPFGNLYGVPVYVEESLTKDDEIAFNAGSHKEVVKLSYTDFARLVSPRVLRFALRPTHAAAWDVGY